MRYFGFTPENRPDTGHSGSPGSSIGQRSEVSRLAKHAERLGKHHVFAVTDFIETRSIIRHNPHLSVMFNSRTMISIRVLEHNMNKAYFY